MKVRRPLRALVVLSMLAISFTRSLLAQESGVLGYWREPGGSVLHTEACGGDVCASIVAISPSAPARVDDKNPNPTLRGRSLCGLRIGEGFHLAAPNKAEDGKLYDPKSGKTYHGLMTSSGKDLHLRGYIGVSLFGRTETWTRTGSTATCTS